MTNFTGKTILVTGATSGMGRATAIAFAKAGATVVAIGRRAHEGQETLDLIRQEGGDEAVFRAVDVGIEAEVVGVIAEIVARHGRLDCAANCAGIDCIAALTDYTEEDYERVFDANVKGLFFCLKHEILAMRGSGGGAIVNVGSIAGEKVIRGNGLYNASKAAANMLTRTAALEAAEHGIRINEVAPGPVETAMLHEFLAQAAAAGSSLREADIAAAAPLKRVGTPEEVAAAIIFLCSKQAAFITGASLAVDGGFRLT
jgi:NAD(P)-dependent dehydrogenase (short-subunit alcohol dehydrogenase family)